MHTSDMRRGIRSLLRRRGPLVFSGTSNRELAERIAGRLGTSLGPVEHETFANGETYCRFGESIRGADVFIVQSCSPPVNDHLVELLLMIHAARLASARRITAVMPWFPYSRQDKKSASREPISARLVADMLEAAGRTASSMTSTRARSRASSRSRRPHDCPAALCRPLPSPREGATLVAVSPDLGRVKLARRLSRALDADLAVVTKTRPGHDLAEVAEVVGARGKVVVMGDDMIVTGGTLVSAGEALLAAGARGARFRDARPLRTGCPRADADVRDL